MNKHLPNTQRKSQSIAPGILPGIHPEDLKIVPCKCGCTRFIPVSELRFASRFQTNTGQPMLINFQGGWACVKCGKINEFDRGAVSGQPGDNGDSVNN